MVQLGKFDDRPAGPEAGLSARRERMWGVLGGAVGAAFGVGAALIAVYVEGAPWTSSSPYPAFFSVRRLLAFDIFLLCGVLAGLIFSITALLLARFGPYPRTDGFGALLGAILSTLGGTILFVRLVALIHG